MKSDAGMDDCDVRTLISQLKTGNKAAREQLLRLIKARASKISKIKAGRGLYCETSADADQVQQQMLDQMMEGLAARPGLSLEAWDRLEHNLLLSQQSSRNTGAGADKARDDARTPEGTIKFKLELLESWCELPGDKQQILRAWGLGKCQDHTSSNQATPEFTAEDLEAAQKLLLQIMASKGSMSK